MARRDPDSDPDSSVLVLKCKETNISFEISTVSSIHSIAAIGSIVPGAL